MDDLISKLSEIRSEYNCFDEDKEPYYRALSKAIRILSSECEYWDDESNFCTLYRPSAERRGRWKTAMLDHEAFGVRPKVLYCSECHQCIAYPTRYCPNCGASMMDEVTE